MKRRCGEGRAQSAQEIPTRDQRHFRESAFKPRRRPMRMVRRLSLVVVTVVLLASLPVAAQQPVAPPPPQIPYGTPISLEQAKKAVAAAEAESRKNHWNMVIAVLDTGGHLVMLERMDGVQLGSIGAAEDKAYSAVMYRRPRRSSRISSLRAGRTSVSSDCEAPACSRAASRSSWAASSSAPSACP